MYSETTFSIGYIYISKIPGKRYINLPKETGMFIRGQPNLAVKLDEHDELKGWISLMKVLSRYNNLVLQKTLVFS